MHIIMFEMRGRATVVSHMCINNLMLFLDEQDNAKAFIFSGCVFFFMFLYVRERDTVVMMIKLT